VTNSLSSTAPFDGGPFVFFIGMGLDGTARGDSDASVRITSVSVEGGGGSVIGDSFDCNR
jgi:hypothetical protein